MRRKLIATFWLVCLTSICNGQIVGPVPAGGKSLYGRFEQTRRVGGIAALLKSNGSFVLAPDYGLIWRVEQPFQAITIITKNGIRQIVDGEEVQHLEPSQAPLFSRLHELLEGAIVGDWSALGRDFTVKTTGDRRAWHAVLTPLRRDDPFTGTISSIDLTGGATVDSVIISRTNGDSEHLSFFDQISSTAPLRAEDTRLLLGKEVGAASHE